jgi:hypothetical protein
MVADSGTAIPLQPVDETPETAKESKAKADERNQKQNVNLRGR